MVIRFINFFLKEKTRGFFAFILYVFFIASFVDFDLHLPFVLELISCIILMVIILCGCIIYTNDWMDNVYEKNKGKIGENIWKELKKIAKELIMFIPISAISTCVIIFVMEGQPENQTSLEESFKEAPIFNSIFMIIIGPILEEFIFRFLPYRFIKNKTLYIFVSTIIFAVMHVIDDPNAFYYIWFYMMRPLYYAYRYHKTKDIWVPTSMHILNNLIATLPMILECF